MEKYFVVKNGSNPETVLGITKAKNEKSARKTAERIWGYWVGEVTEVAIMDSNTPPVKWAVNWPN